MAAQRQCQEANLFPSYSTQNMTLTIKRRYLTCKCECVDIVLGQLKHAAMLLGGA